MEPKTWKILAIIFICMFIFETLLFGWLYIVGSEIIRNEEICASKWGIEPAAGFYQYDDYISTCYCINGDGEFVKEIELS